MLVMSSEPIIKIVEGDSTNKSENYLEIDERDGHFNFEIDNPWAGDTLTGIGETAHVQLNADQAKRLADWIYSRLATPA